jgi:hypothetical protein
MSLIEGLRSMEHGAELNNCGLLIIEENKREERCREQKEVRWLILFSGNTNLGLGLEKKSYLYCFFKCWPGEPVRFNWFQTLETKIEPNQKFFVIF